MRVLIFLLLALSAVGQDVVPNRRNHFRLSSSSIIPGPTNVTFGLAYWWVSSDMITNITVTNWIDRIQASVWTNISTDTKCPTNSSLGCHFLRSSSQRLTNAADVSTRASNYNGTDTNTMFFLVQPSSIPIGRASWIGVNPSSTANSFGINGGQPYFCGATLCDSSTALLSSGTLIDVVVVSSGSAASPVIKWYTNGVVANTNTTVTDDSAFRSLGGNGLGFYDGYMIEVGLYTNAITPTIVSNLHRYFTNTYTFSP